MRLVFFFHLWTWLARGWKSYYLTNRTRAGARTLTYVQQYISMCSGRICILWWDCKHWGLVSRVIRSRQLNGMFNYPRIWNKCPNTQKSRNRGFLPTFSLRFWWLGRALNIWPPKHMMWNTDLHFSKFWEIDMRSSARTGSKFNLALVNVHHLNEWSQRPPLDTESNVDPTRELNRLVFTRLDHWLD